MDSNLTDTGYPGTPPKETSLSENTGNQKCLLRPRKKGRSQEDLPFPFCCSVGFTSGELLHSAFQHRLRNMTGSASSRAKGLNPSAEQPPPEDGVGSGPGSTAVVKDHVSDQSVRVSSESLYRILQ